MKSHLLKKIAVLEALNDQLSSDNEYIDRLIHLLGLSEELLMETQTADEKIRSIDK